MGRRSIDRFADLRRELLDFYDRGRRELPWRRDRDPYRVWVSEVMLQQTRADVVVPYYERWLARFPDLTALAHADLDAVLAAWAGLGYYRRARDLHRAARIVQDRHGGRVPEGDAALRSLPGVGEYTAGAIASIAFDRPEPAVDANVRRVLARLLDLAEPSPAVLRETARALAAGPRPGDLNQALMELGATVCAPRAPDCPACPLAAGCRARTRGTQLERPRPRRRKAVPTESIATAVVAAGDGALLLARRPDEGLLGGMWEFPGIAARAPAPAARRLAESLFEAPAPVGKLARIEHRFSHRRHVYHAYRFRVDGRPAPRRLAGRTALRWVDPDGLERVALPAAQRRIAAAC